MRIAGAACRGDVVLAEKREPYRHALLELRRRLRSGEMPPGARVTAKEVAETLSLSATPIREALSRLAGEGLLEEHRGDGFFIPKLSGADIAALFRLSEHVLVLAQSHREEVAAQTDLGSRIDLDNPVLAIEQLFQLWASEARSAILMGVYRPISARLGPARRLEPRIIDDLRQEADGLLRLSDPMDHRRRFAAIRTFHRRRIAIAPRLAAALQPAPGALDE